MGKSPDDDGDTTPEQQPGEVPESKEDTSPMATNTSLEKEVTTEDAPPAKKTKGKPKKKFDAMSDAPMKFKDVSFENALTADEKAAKKAAKKGKKPKKEKPVEEDEKPPLEQVAEQSMPAIPSEKMIIAEQVMKQQEQPQKKAKKGKKAKEGQADKVKKESPRAEEGEKKPEETKKKEKKKEKKEEEVESPADAPGPEGEAKRKKGKKEKTKLKKEKSQGSESVSEVQTLVSMEKITPKSTDQMLETPSQTKTKGSKTEVSEEITEVIKKPKKGKGKKGEVSALAAEPEEKEERKKKKKKVKVDISHEVSAQGLIEAGRSKEGLHAPSSTMSAIPSLSPSGQPSIASSLTKSIVRSQAGLPGEPKKRSLMTPSGSRMLTTPSSRFDKSKSILKGKISSVYSSSMFGNESLMSGASLASSSSSKSVESDRDKKPKKGKAKIKAGPEEADALDKKEKRAKAKKRKKEQTEPSEPSEPTAATPKPPVKEPPKEKPEEKPKKKKGKKADVPEEEDDVMAQIMKMKQQALAPVSEEPTEPSQLEKKKGKKEKPPKKLSKKERAKLEAQRLEEARIQAELEAQMALEEERRRQENLRKNAKEKDRRDTAEQALRSEQLAASNGLIKAMMSYNWNICEREKADAEWAQYLKCDGLPDVSNPAQMNTYLHLWEQVANDVAPEECSRKTDEVLELLRSLNDFIDDPFDARQSIKDDWVWVRSLCRNAQQNNLDMATYRLVRDIDSRMNRLDIPTADYKIVDDNFVLCLWLQVQLATPMYNPRTAQKPRIKIIFPELKMHVLFPWAIDGKCVVVRGIYVKYDHISDNCASFDSPPVPKDFQTDLLGAMAKEWYVKMMYKWTHRKRKRQMVEDEQGNLIEGPEEPEPELQEGELPPQVPFQLLEPTPSNHAIMIEDEMYGQIREALESKNLDEKALNLRKYLIIGGVYYLNLFYQPPQPHDKVAFDIRLTGLLIPKRLSEVPFSSTYSPPSAEDNDNKKSAEELEEDAKKQEREFDKLIKISVMLPDHVVFLDLPIICAWDKDEQIWTTDDLYDVRHIEEKNLVTFRTTRFGAFSFAVNRYINLPFQTWELRPEHDGTVTLQLTCAILMVEFNVKGNTLCLTQLQNSPNNALQDIIGEYFKLPKLMRILREGGIDLFPAFDAFCYLESGVCEKHWPMEKHLYYLMGLLSCCFNFTWSRWNVQADRRSIIMQMREFKHDRPRQQNHQMLLVTPQKALLINCTEISPNFNDEPVTGMKFYADLYNLMKGISTMSTKNKVLKGPRDVAKAVADLLIATRIHSFS